MAWTGVKTNWLPTDYFNVVDYNRVVGNLEYLRGLASELFEEITFTDVPSTKTVNDKILPSEMTAIENNLYLLNTKTYQLSKYEIGEKKRYKGNGKTHNYEDMNRIEDAIIRLYNIMTAHKASLPRLAITLGGQKGFKV